MPAALDVNWGEVRMLAVQIGVREAARRLDLSEEAVKKRCTREGWLAGLPRNVPLPPTMVRSVPNVPSASQIMVQELVQNGQKSRLALSRGLRKAAEHVEHMDGQEILIDAQNIKSTAQSLSLVHGWQNQAPTAKISLSLVAGQEQQPMTIDAEFTDMQTIEDDPLAGF